jgi:hypothetical protein
VEELTCVVRGQQTSLDAIQGSLKLIEVVMCTKTTNDVSIKKDAEVSIPVSNTVINLGDDTNEEEDQAGLRGKHKTVSTDYDSELDKDKEAADTDLVFSDGDYEYYPDEMNKKICKTVENLNMQIKQNFPIPVMPDAWTTFENVGRTTDLSNPMRFSNSNFKRVSNPMMESAEGGYME